MRAAIGALLCLGACGQDTLEDDSKSETQSVAITAFSSPTSSSVLDPLLAAFPNAQVETLDHLYHPDRAQEFGIPSNGYAQVYRLDANGQALGQGERIDLDLPPEAIQSIKQKLQTPLTRVHLHFPSTDSHNPKDQFTLLQKALATRGLDSVALSEEPDLVIWMAGSEDLSEEALTQLRTLQSSGSHLLLGVEPTRDPQKLPRLTQLLSTLGVSLEPGVLASDFQQVWETLGTPSSHDRYNHAASRFMAHPATGSLGENGRSDLSVIFSHAAIISPRHGSSTQAAPLLLSHKEAWTEITHDGQVGENERLGSLPLALASNSPSPSTGRTVVLADTTALSNRWALHPGNKMFFSELLRWLLPETETSVKEYPPKPEPVSPMPAIQIEGSLRSAVLQQSVRKVELLRKQDTHGRYVWGIVTGKRESREFLGNALAESALSEFQSLNSIRTWSSPSPDRLKALGFDAPTGELLLTDNSGRSYSLKLGGSPYNAQGRYAFDEQSQKVHLLVSSGLAALLGPEIALEDTRFLPEADWHRFEIPRERTLRVERRDTQWFVAGRKGVENQGLARDLARELLALKMAEADVPPPSGQPAFQAEFIDQERNRTQVLLHRTDDGWLAFSDYSRRWGRVSPRIGERIVQLANSLP